MFETEDSVIFTKREINYLVKNIMLSETEEEVKENLIKSLKYIVNPKVLIIEE